MKKILEDKWKLTLLVIKVLTGVLGGSLVLAADHPYIALTVLAVGAVANEVINFYKVDVKQ